MVSKARVYCESEGFLYREMVPEDVDECLGFCVEMFTKHEEISKHLNVKDEEHYPWYKAWFEHCSRNGLSLTVVEQSTGKIRGCGLIEDLTVHPPNMDQVYAAIPDRVLPEFLVADAAEEKFAQMRREEGRPIQKGEFAFCVLGVVHKDFFNSKIASVSIREHVKLAREKGFKYFSACTTGDISRHIQTKKIGLTQMCSVDYQAWEYTDRSGRTYKPFLGINQKRAKHGACFCILDLHKPPPAKL